MSTRVKIQQMIERSRQIIKDCSLDNGAIVASNSSKRYYPKEANDYRFVWPRDGAYICLGAETLGVDVQEKFFRWCEKAEGFQKTGLFYRNYSVNGKKSRIAFQPDQNGTLLFAIWHHCNSDKSASKRFEKLIRKAADGLCRVWSKDHFTLATEDIWEERHCFPDIKSNFAYSLAACSRGLSCADELFPNRRWAKAAAEMRKTLIDGAKDNFFRSSGKLCDERIDASLLGLVWPFGIIKPDDKRMLRTVTLIEQRIVKGFGVFRYENDDYDGWQYVPKVGKRMHRKCGAGYWPLLSLWMSMYYLEKGDRKKALLYYNKVVNDVKGNNLIPEQIFQNDIQVSVSPLCWAHAMFAIVSEKLGYL